MLEKQVKIDFILSTYIGAKNSKGCALKIMIYIVPTYLGVVGFTPKTSDPICWQQGDLKLVRHFDRHVK